VTLAHQVRLAGALAAGAASVFGFAPFNLPAVPIVTMALLFALWLPATPRVAAQTGFAFGVGLFGAGASWVYVAINTFGGMPWFLAAIGTAIWTAYLALFPALTGWLAARFAPEGSIARALCAAAIWTLAEIFRGTGYTGFPWLALGYAQLPIGADALASPLAGYATIGGVGLVTLAVVLCAALLALAIDAFPIRARERLAALAIAALAIVGGGAIATTIGWTAPVGKPVAISLVQGDVAQDLKFEPAVRDQTYQLYLDLVGKSRGRLIVLPESAFPVFADEVPDPVLIELLRNATARHGDVLVGMFTAEPPLPGHEQMRYYNSVVTLGEGEVQLYRKRHLVPFGETIPIEPVVGWFIRAVLAIPISDQSAGDPRQVPLDVAGQKVAMTICYEDAFGGELRAQAAASTLIVNVTNDAWYGRSLAAEQHNQIAAMRALEAARPLVRATNTGITSAFDYDGRELARLPWFTRGILEVTLSGRTGTTPYVRWGDAIPLALSALLVVVAFTARRRSRRFR